MSFATPLALLFALAGQASPSPSSAAPPAKRVLVGKVREVSGPGDRAQALLAAESGGEWILHPLESVSGEELRRLAGAKVRVLGIAGEPQSLWVHRYELLEVGGGARPRIGMLAALPLGGKEKLLFVGDDGDADLLPEGWSRKLRPHLGARLWMVGERKGEVFQPLRFMILRPRARAFDAGTP